MSNQLREPSLEEIIRLKLMDESTQIGQEILKIIRLLSRLEGRKKCIVIGYAHVSLLNFLQEKCPGNITWVPSAKIVGDAKLHENIIIQNEIDADEHENQYDLIVLCLALGLNDDPVQKFVLTRKLLMPGGITIVYEGERRPLGEISLKAIRNDRKVNWNDYFVRCLFSQEDFSSFIEEQSFLLSKIIGFESLVFVSALASW